MAIEIKIGEPHLTIHHDYAVLLGEPDGAVQIKTVDGELKECTLAIAISRTIGPGLHEDIERRAVTVPGAPLRQGGGTASGLG